MARDKNKYQNIYKQIGLNIKNQRKIIGISQEELAFRLQSARNYIGCIERGEKQPSLSFLLDIAEFLNIEVYKLFKPLN
jgi:transcriptional regulator with XRE-family HTH domain